MGVTLYYVAPCTDMHMYSTIQMVTYHVYEQDSVALLIQPFAMRRAILHALVLRSVRWGYPTGTPLLKNRIIPGRGLIHFPPVRALQDWSQRKKGCKGWVKNFVARRNLLDLLKLQKLVNYK